MKELINIFRNQTVVSSIDVAKSFEKEHKTVLRNIKNLVAQNCATKNMFYKTHREYRGQKFPHYLMTRDGFSLLVMGFTGKKALDWKVKYIQAFNAMEKKLAVVDKQKESLDWMQKRRESLLDRSEETTTIKEFVEYALANGANEDNLKWIYSNYTKLENKVAGIVKPITPERATIDQLHLLSIARGIIKGTLLEWINKKLPYKTAYAECKTRINTLENMLKLGMVHKRITA